jgi:hypothetical protein
VKELRRPRAARANPIEKGARKTESPSPGQGLAPKRELSARFASETVRQHEL